MADFEIMDAELLGLTTSLLDVDPISSTRVCTFFVLLVAHKHCKQIHLNKYIA